MDKLGVRLETPPEPRDGEKVAQAERCPRCGQPLDAQRACAEHGTEPLEKRPTAERS